MKSGLALLIAILTVLANASAVQAHASLIHSEPPDRAVLAQAPPDLKLTFNEPVSPLVLRLVRPTGEIAELQGSMAADGATIVLGLPSGPSRGTHLLSWRVVSADGHPVGGALTFSIGQPSAEPASPQSADIGLRAAIWLTRLLVYLGLFIGIGGAFFGAWVATSQLSGWARALTSGALVCGLCAALLSVGLHGADLLGVRLADIGEIRVWASGLASVHGFTLCIAAVSLALGLAALTGEGSISRWFSGLALAGVGGALAASGHASTAGPALVTRPTVFLHAVCIAFWLGALPPLAARLAAGHGRVELVRFSKAIPGPFLLLIATGVLLAIIQVRQIEALWTTSYGIILSCKLGAVCLLVGLAAMNRWLTWRVIEEDARASRQLQASIRTEIAIMVLILGLVASWRFTPPPRALLLAAGQPVHAHIHTDRAMADMRIEPTRADGRRIILTLLDGEFAALTAKEVTLVLHKPDAGIEPLRLTAKQVDATMWQIDGIRLPLPGRWRVRVEILISDFDKISIEDEVDLSR